MNIVNRRKYDRQGQGRQLCGSYSIYEIRHAAADAGRPDFLFDVRGFDICLGIGYCGRKFNMECE